MITLMVQGINAGKSQVIAAIQDLAGAMPEAFVAPLQAIIDFISRFGNAIVTVFTGIGKTAISVIQPLQNAMAALKVFLSSIFSGDMAGAWQAVKDFIVSSLTAILNAVNGWVSTLHTLFTTLLSSISSAWEAFWSDVRAVLTGILDWIESTTGISMEGARSAVTAALTAIQTAFSTAFSSIEALLNALWSIWSSIFTNISTFTTGTLENLPSGTVSTVTSIKSAIVDGMSAAVDWIKSLPEQAFQWGSDIIGGIVNGITSAVSTVGDAVAGVAGKIKAFIGFSEPETGPLSDFHTYMPDMISLMAQGIQKGRAVVRKAVSDLTGDVSDGLRMEDDEPDPDTGNPKLRNGGGGFFGGSGGIVSGISTIAKNIRDTIPNPGPDAGAFLSNAVNGMSAFARAAQPQPSTISTVTGSNNVSRSVVQNAEINNKFQGDSAIQRHAASTMDKSAKDVTAELARGLAYAK